jgi:hypothetical protein
MKSSEPILDVASVSTLTGVRVGTLYYAVQTKSLKAARRNPIGLTLSTVGQWNAKRKLTGTCGTLLQSTVFIVPSNVLRGWNTTWLISGWTALVSSAVSSLKIRGMLNTRSVEERSTALIP